MTNLDSILKSRDITLPTKACLVKVMVFPVVMYGCETWTVKKAEHWKIDAFELWCWRRLLRVPWTARRYNQSILKEISPGYSLEGLMLKLKLQYSGHLMQKNRLIWLMKRPWCWERLRAGWEGENRWWDGWMVSPTQWTLVWVNSGSWWWTERPGVLQSTDYRVGHDWSTEMNWTEWFWTFFHVLIGYPYICFCDVFIWEVLIKCLNFVIFAADDIIMEELDKDRMCVVCVKLYQLCPTLCDPIDCSLPVSSILGILQARILQWVAMPFSRGSFWPRDWTCVFYVSCIGKQVLYH